MAFNELANQCTVVFGGFAVSTVGIHTGKGSPEFLLRARFLLIAQETQRLADHFARVAEFPGANLTGDELLPVGRQRNVHARQRGTQAMIVNR